MSLPYKPINKDSRDIRLLTLRRGEWQDDIDCGLHVVSLDENPKYEALSYTWGSGSLTKPIFVNSNEVRVTVNLEAALRHIRSANRSHTLWIDALCINQDDVAEKTHQVALMGEMYKGCTSCYAWLGCPDEYFEGRQRSPDELVLKMYKQDSNPFEFFSHFAQDKHWYELPCFPSNPDDIDANSHEYSRRLLNLPIWKGFYTIASSPWWTRVWTLQEAVLPPEITILFGHWTVPWETMESAHMCSLSHEQSCCVKSGNALLGYTQNSIIELFDEVSRISFSRKYTPRFRSTQLVFARRECRDPRDRIYGMLGMNSYGTRLRIDPDYSLRLREVYTKAFQSTIKEYDGDLVAMCGLGFNSKYGGLPSWVPNFATPVDFDGQRNQFFHFRYQYQCYQASKDRMAKYSFEESGILRLSGVKAGVVADVCAPKKTYSMHDASEALSRLAEVARVPEYQFKESGAEYDTRYEMLWRTVLSDIVVLVRVNGCRRLLHDDFEEFQNLRFQARLATWPNASPMYDPDLRFIRGVRAALHNRCFFITEDDKFGTGPPQMEAGDEVWVLFGSRVPFILRPITNVKQGNRSNAYNFIGDCYLHGIMDGQALDVGAPEVMVNLY